MEDESSRVERLPSGFEYVSFDVKKEPWNRYKLEDGAILKTKLVLINVIAEQGFKQQIRVGKLEKGAQIRLIFQTNNIIGVEVSASMTGEPGKERYNHQVLESSVTQEDMDFETIQEGWNIYQLEGHALLKARSSPIRLRRTSKYDAQGIPIYMVDFRTDVKIGEGKSGT